MDITTSVARMGKMMGMDITTDPNDEELTVNDFQEICGYSEEEAKDAYKNVLEYE